MDTLARLGTDVFPAGGYQDVDVVDVSPASTGGVEDGAALRQPGLHVVDDLLAVGL